MRAVGYFRPVQRSLRRWAGSSIDPLRLVERYCAENDHRLVVSFGSDAPESAVDELGQFRSLVEFFRSEQGRPALVLIPDSSHLAPDLPLLVERLIELSASGGEVRCIDPDLPDPLQSGLALLGTRGSLQERHRRVREAIVAKAARGEVLGRTPFGYVAGLDGLLKPEPEEAEIVRSIFDRYVGDDIYGDRAASPGWRRIAARLNDAGTLTRRRGRWTPAAVGGVLRNRVYLGNYSRFGVHIVGCHPSIVERAVFDRAQVILSGRRPARVPKRPGAYLLRGLVVCGECGSGVSGLTRRRSWVRTDGTSVEREYRYYECPSRPRRRVTGGVADLASDSRHASWRADRLEWLIRGEIERIPGAAGADTPVEAGPDAAETRRRVAARERRFMRALRAVASGAGTLDELSASVERLRLAERAAVHVAPTRTVAELVDEALNAPDEAARNAVGALVERVVLTDSGAQIIARVLPASNAAGALPSAS